MLLATVTLGIGSFSEFTVSLEGSKPRYSQSRLTKRSTGKEERLSRGAVTCDVLCPVPAGIQPTNMQVNTHHLDPLHFAGCANPVHE
jgi:hypothetical protein